MSCRRRQRQRFRQRSYRSDQRYPCHGQRLRHLDRTRQLSGQPGQRHANCQQHHGCALLHCPTSIRRPLHRDGLCHGGEHHGHHRRQQLYRGAWRSGLVHRLGGGTITAASVNLQSTGNAGTSGAPIKTDTSSLSATATNCLFVCNSGSALTVNKAVGGNGVGITNNNGITVASQSGTCPTVKGTSVCILANGANPTIVVGSGTSACKPTIQATSGNVTVRTSNSTQCACHNITLNNDSVKASGTASIIAANTLLEGSNSLPDIIAPTVSLVASAKCGTTSSGQNGKILGITTQASNLSAAAGANGVVGICVTNSGAVTVSQLTSTGTTHLQNNNNICIPTNGAISGTSSTACAAVQITTTSGNLTVLGTNTATPTIQGTNTGSGAGVKLSAPGCVKINFKNSCLCSDETNDTTIKGTSGSGIGVCVQGGKVVVAGLLTCKPTIIGSGVTGIP